MLLIITNKLDTTADVVIDRLNRGNTPFVRWNTEDLLCSHKITLKISAGKVVKALLRAEGRTVDLENDISVIWYRRPEKAPPHVAIRKSSHKEFARREGSMLLSNLWSLLGNKVWVNYPANNLVLNNKLYQLTLAEQLGMTTPATLVTNNPSEARRFIKEHGEVATKALSAGVLQDGKREKLIYTRKIREEDVAKFDSIRLCPTLFQAYVPKEIELRVTVIEDSVFACAIESQRSARTVEDWRRYDFSNVPHYPFTLPRKLHKQLITFLRKTGLKFGAFDFILTPNGEYVFLEINPNGQWYWIEKLTGMPITDRLVKLFEHCIERG